MARRRKLVILAGGAAEAIAVLRHGRRATRRHRAPGGILIGDAVVYDALSRLLLGSLVERVAADTATVAPGGARVLEVGCGPGHLSTRLAHHHGFDVTGLDLDPAMIARAQANADRPGTATSAGHRFSSATWPHWRSPVVGRSSGTSGPVSGHICSDQAMCTSPTRSTTRVVRRFGW
jgi:SAM-dependent methyltransferase